MKLIQLFILLSSIFLFSNCQSRTDNTREKAFLTYLVTCTGGSVTACQNTCAPSCGLGTSDLVPADKLSCMTSCQSTCSTNCNSLGLLFTFIK